MGRINILDKHVAELIAAGEVVERPSSVIKELVENAIDAGATAVTVEIKNGGVTFMRVSDNGSGILKEDIRPAFIRHATSKVREEDDLDAIATLGFRGEALASIASVSHLELITKAREEETGTRCLIEGGEEKSLSDAGCPDGTTFIIRDLFYNVPARMKFLKTDMAEGNAVSNVIDKIALSHPEIAITYIKDQKPALRTAGDGKLLSAIYAVYGRDFARGLIPVDYTLGGIHVTGFISHPENARPNRNMQNFFINNRFVICKTAMAAISEACKGSVMVGKFPSCVLNLEMSFNAVDVNVHPTKLEVRFVNERPVFDAVYHAVKTALLSGEKRVEAHLPVNNLKPVNRVNPFELAQKVFRERDEKPVIPVSKPVQKLDLKREEKRADELFRMLDDTAQKPIAMNVQAADSASPFADGYREHIAQKRMEAEQEEPEPVLPQPEQKPSVEPAPEAIGEPKPLIDIDNNYYKYIGEAFKTYIIIEKNDHELLLIDKHAAHERIIYERLKKEKGSGCSQLLLTPLTVTLNKQDYNSVIADLDVFREAGFDIDDFGNGSIIVRSAPQYLPLEDIEPSVIEMAGYLTENKREIRSEKMDWIYANVSCRAAIKGGNRSTEQELIELARQVEDEDIRHCPHGRPVCIVLKKRELERMFGRIE
ncbi:DNA mismatch repair endonuclease MutL [uncultured Ruminococcus sp.]|uniref:DNA mismatch repair endonuclease MutL n=1 Tax=uncultured Ruminococcus sp. TaxID=165186 RepID=UPI00292CF519|nr:DNA mismatch repair endonuclease MutL [uncultured Ruminococcus sp.]